MQEWWKHHESRLPIVDENEKIYIEDITGRSPLLLRALLGQNGKQFKDIKHEFLESESLKFVPTQVEKFVRDKKIELNSSSESWMW